MKLEEYKREIGLMKRQNFTEYDMYSVIAPLMRKGSNIKKLSLRDVNRRWGRTNRGRVFYGLSSVPDFAILDVDFVNSENWMNDVDMVYGCVEIKGIDKKLLSIDGILTNIINGEEITLDEGQFLGEVLWYKKVLYTNGLVWKFIEWNKDESSWKTIKDLVQDRIDKENGAETKEEKLSEWYINLSDKINLKEITIKEKTLITIAEDTTDNDWNDFIKELYNIKWN